jgi:hypothetical protein
MEGVAQVLFSSLQHLSGEVKFRSAAAPTDRLGGEERSRWQAQVPKQ